MKENLQISTRVRRLVHYLEDFERGIIRVPAFQRDFEWDHKKKVKLFDSIKRGYPIGSILFWRPDFKTFEDFKNFETEKIGSYFLTERSIDYFYILDGYQRLSTLFGCLINPSKTNLERDENEWKKQFNLIYNLEKDSIEFSRKGVYEVFEVQLYKFIDGSEFYDFQEELSKLDLPKTTVNTYLERYRNFGVKLSSYDIPSIDMIGGSTEEAIDIFTRLNSEGAKITDVWKLSALSFNHSRNFRLGSEIDSLLKNLEVFNFNKLPIKIIFQAITNSFGDVYFDKISKNDTKKLAEMARDDNFVDVVKSTLHSIRATVKFFYKDLNILNNKLIPYASQLIFITDFFNQVGDPSKTQLAILKKWFWITTYSNYFTSNLSKQRLAYQKFQAFINGKVESPLFRDNDDDIFVTQEFPSKITMGSVRAKALALFILNYQEKFTASDIQNFEKYKVIKLFRNEGNISENTIFVKRKNLHLLGNRQNISDWYNSENDLSMFFITQAMKDAYKNGAGKNTVLKMRRDHIIFHEKAFVENLGITYIPDYEGTIDIKII